MARLPFAARPGRPDELLAHLRSFEAIGIEHLTISLVDPPGRRGPEALRPGEQGPPPLTVLRGTVWLGGSAAPRALDTNHGGLARSPPGRATGSPAAAARAGRPGVSVDSLPGREAQWACAPAFGGREAAESARGSPAPTPGALAARKAKRSSDTVVSPIGAW